MKKEYKRRKDETLSVWIERIVPAMMGKGLAEVHDMVAEVSKESYIVGVHAGQSIFKH